MAQGSAGYLWDVTVNDGGGAVALDCVSNSFDVSFDSDDTTEQGEAGESNTLTIQRCALSFEIVWPAAALSGGKQDVVEAFFNKTELGVVVTPAGSTSGNNTYTFNGRVHDLSMNPNGPAGTVRATGTIRNSDGGTVSLGTVA